MSFPERRSSRGHALKSLDKFMPKKIQGVTYLRYLTAIDLRNLDGAVTICRHSEKEPLAVLMPFSQFMDMQRTIFDFEKQVLAEEAALSQREGQQ